MKFFKILFLLLLFSSVKVFAQAPGTIDSTFGGTGMIEYDYGYTSIAPSFVGQQSGGKMIVFSYANNGVDLIVSRYNDNGSLDSSFGISGKKEYVGFNMPVIAGVVDADDKTIVGGANTINGNTDIILFRFLSNGNLDSSFGTNGKVKIDLTNQDDFRAIEIQLDGKILISGSTNLKLLVSRLNTNGTSDVSFGASGVFSVSIGGSGAVGMDISQQLDGKIIVGGYSSVLYQGYFYEQVTTVRILDNGVLDSNYGNAGVVVSALGNNSVAFGFCVGVTYDSKIVASGRYHRINEDYVFIIRYNSDGLIDSSFGTNGIVGTDLDDEDMSYQQIQLDGKILIACPNAVYPIKTTVARFNQNGSVDSTFGLNGRIIAGPSTSPLNYPNCFKLLPNKKFIIAGYANYGSNTEGFISRYYTDNVAPIIISSPPSQSICFGTSKVLQLQLGGGPEFNYKWFRNNQQISTNESLLINNTTFADSGTYYCIVSNSAGSDTSASFYLSVNSLPTVNIGNNVNVCSGATTTLSAGSFVSYSWNTGSNSNSITVNSEGDYFVEVTDINQCKNNSNIVHVSIVTPYNQLQLCAVTYDSLSRHNIIVWDKPASSSIQSFRIYKESGSVGNYVLIGTVAYSSPAQFIDLASLPKSFSYKYKISVVDTCNNESTLSDFIRTMQLTVSANTSSGYNLIWTDYMLGTNVYASSYNVYRGSSIDNLQLVYSNVLPSGTGTTTMVDNSPLSAPSYYMVSYSLGHPCTYDRTSVVVDYSMSNIEEVLVTDINKQKLNTMFKVYPNPVKDKLVIETSNKNVSLVLINSVGQTIKSFSIDSSTTIDVSELLKGIYILKANTSEDSVYKTFVKE